MSLGVHRKVYSRRVLHVRYRKGAPLSAGTPIGVRISWRCGMAAGSRTRINGLLILLTVPAQPLEPGRRLSASAAGQAGAGRATGWPGTGPPVAGEPVPSRLPRLPGDCRATARATAQIARQLSRKHTAPAAGVPSADQRRQCGTSGQEPEPASARKAQAPAGPHRVKERTVNTTAVQRPGTRRTSEKAPRGTWEVYKRYKKGTRRVHQTSRNRRDSLPLWHLIRGRK
jgi:hypothetical protein